MTTVPTATTEALQAMWGRSPTGKPVVKPAGPCLLAGPAKANPASEATRLTPQAILISTFFAPPYRLCATLAVQPSSILQSESFLRRKRRIAVVLNFRSRMNRLVGPLSRWPSTEDLFEPVRYRGQTPASERRFRKREHHKVRPDSRAGPPLETLQTCWQPDTHGDKSESPGCPRR